MASLLAKIRSSTAASQASGSSTPKKDPNATLLTPLERHLRDAGPIQDDGSDKFFGMENVSTGAAENATDIIHD
ncbi:MAG: hypothetical protein Q9215_001905 [Flavoplaca cf. flavocitrina]